MQVSSSKNGKNLLFSALGIGRAMVLGTNAELGTPAKPDRRSSGGDDLQGYGGNAQIKTVVKRMRMIKVRKQIADFHKPAVLEIMI